MAVDLEVVMAATQHEAAALCRTPTAAWVATQVAAEVAARVARVAMAVEAASMEAEMKRHLPLCSAFAFATKRVWA